MKWVHFVVAMVLLAACQTNKPNYQQFSAREQKILSITAQVSRKIQEETGLRLIGRGGGVIGEKRLVRKLNMSFSHYGVINMEKGRELVIYCMQEYLSAINGCEEIREELVHYPFTPQDVEITLFIRGPKNEDIPIGELDVIYIVKGIIKYKIEQPGIPSMKEIHRETYGEALKIVEETDPSMQLIKKVNKQ
jgi:hypothetical protein